MANTSNFQVTTGSANSEGIELNFSGLYLYHTYYGKSPNQVIVVDRSDFGILVANNWVVKDGLGPNAKVVAHAQGLHILAGHWHNSFSLVFEDERFKGSTLQVMGMVVEQGEWAIVGGTGQFAMANGVIYKSLHEKTDGGDVIELTVKGFCPKLKSSTVQILPTKIGTWGGDKGLANDIVEPPKRLESITIRSGWIVDSIEFSYVDQAGQKHTAGPWGGDGGQPNKIQLGPNEFVKEVSGTHGVFQGEAIVTSIKVVTNLNTYGPYGQQKESATSKPFSVPVQGGSAVAGFFARSGKQLNAIGVYVAPL